MSSIIASQSNQLEGLIRVPGDKSISHRAVILGAIAVGESKIQHLLEGEDVLATVAAFQAMGVEMSGPRDGSLHIKGVGLNGLTKPDGPLDMGNSGTAMRLLAGLLSGQVFPATLTGDVSLRQRPMERIITPLSQMGADLTAADGKPPLAINPVSRLTGISYRLPMASAQVKSSILLAGLYAKGGTQIHESTPTRDHTERMIAGFTGGRWEQGNPIQVDSGHILRGQQITVPGDISSAAFFLVAAALCPGSDVTLCGIGINPTRAAVLEILNLMGANIEIFGQRQESGEPLCDLRVRSQRLKGIDVPQSLVANAIDEFPVLAIAAAGAVGITRIRGATELRFKESDRINAVVQGLGNLGVNAIEYEDGMDITGGGFRSGTIDSRGDHRIAMAFAVAGCCSDGPVVVNDCQNIATSFPGFVEIGCSLGMNLVEKP
jgi:3-phosphoshikimate 1-carboxyvinyltransferase